MDYAVSKPFTFDDALKQSGFGKFNYLLMALSGGLMASAFLELTSVNIIFPIAQCDLNLSTSDKGIVSAIGYVGVILSSHFWGFLADTKGRKATLVPSLLLAFAATLVSSFVTNFWLMVSLRFLNGFFISCASATTFAFLGEFHDARNRGRVLMITSILYSLSCLFLPTFAILTVNQQWSFNIDFLGVTYKPWRLFLVICSLPSLVCAIVLIFFIPETPKYTFSQGDDIETLKIFQKIYKMNTGKSIITFDVKSLIKDGEFGESRQTKPQNFFKFMWAQSVPLFQGFNLKNMLTACFLQFSTCVTGNGFWTFLPEILNKISLWEDSERGSATVCDIYKGTNFLNTLNNQTDLIIVPVCVQKLEMGTFLHIYEIVLFYAICYTAMSFLINRIGKLVIVEVVFIICTIQALLLMFVTTTRLLPYIYVIMVLSGLSISIVNASTVELFPTKLRAMAICISMMVGRLGSTTGSLIIGAVIDEYCTYTFIMPLILLSISGCLAFTIPNINKRVK